MRSFILVLPHLVGARHFADYGSYESFQHSKMGNETSGSRGMHWIRHFDSKNEQGLFRYLNKGSVRPLVGSPVLCVGARSRALAVQFQGRHL